MLLSIITDVKKIGSIFLLTAFLLAACQPQVAEAPAPPIEIDPERAAQLATEIRDEVSVRLAEGLQLSLWASD